MCVADLELCAPLDFILEINLFLVAACEFYLVFFSFSSSKWKTSCGCECRVFKSLAFLFWISCQYILIILKRGANPFIRDQIRGNILEIWVSMGRKEK